MSLNATLEGRITFRSDADYDAAVAALRQGPWLDEEGRFLDEGRDVVDPAGRVDAVSRSITIPFAVYRDLIRLIGVVTPLFSTATGRVVWTCLDGGLTRAGVFTIADGAVVCDVEIELEPWGAEHLADPTPDEADDPEAYLEWVARAESAWLDENR